MRSRVRRRSGSSPPSDRCPRSLEWGKGRQLHWNRDGFDPLTFVLLAAVDSDALPVADVALARAQLDVVELAHEAAVGALTVWG